MPARRRFSFSPAVPRNNQLIIRTADTKTMERIGELIAELDVPTPLVLLEVQVLAPRLGDDFRSAFDYQFSDGKSVAGGFINNVDSFTTGNILPPCSSTPGASIASNRSRQDPVGSWSSKYDLSGGEFELSLSAASLGIEKPRDATRDTPVAHCE